MVYTDSLVSWLVQASVFNRAPMTSDLVWVGEVDETVVDKRDICDVKKV